MKRFALLLLSIVLVSCSAPNTPDAERAQVMASIPPLASLTSDLLRGTAISAQSIVPPGSSFHTYQLTPGIVRQIEDAKLIVLNGLEIEHFLEDAIEQSGASLVVTTDGLDTSLLSSEDAHEDEHGHEDAHHHGELDPHVWLDPMLALSQSEKIRDALITTFPDVQDRILENFRILEDRLKTLDTSLKDRFSRLNIGPFLVFHDAYAYFEHAYDIHPVGSLEPFPGKEPSAKYLKELIDEITEHDVRVLFTEPQFSPKLAVTLSEDYDLILLELNPLGEDYFVMMENNMRSFETAFKERP